jgi:hypothetical protein
MYDEAPSQQGRCREKSERPSTVGKLNALIAKTKDVNQKLHELSDAGIAPYQICYFKRGDQKPWYQSLLSRETIRKALIKSGLRIRATV